MLTKSMMSEGDDVPPANSARPIAPINANTFARNVSPGPGVAAFVNVLFVNVCVSVVPTTLDPFASPWIVTDPVDALALV